MAGETVEVRRFDGTEWESETVENVLPGLPSTEGGSSGGAATFVEFHFPKAYGKSLEGAWILRGGRMHQVMGDPQPLLGRLTPGPWNRPAKAAARAYSVPVSLMAKKTVQDACGRTSVELASAWEGLCRVREAAEDEAWAAGGARPQGSLSLSAMPDEALLSAGAAAAVAVVGGREMDVVSVQRTGGVGSELRIECAERGRP